MPYLSLADFVFEQSSRPRAITVGYRTYGRLSPAADNVVLLPSYFTGTSDDYAGWIGPAALVDPRHWYVIAVDMLGNGRSTSPSTAPGVLPPIVTMTDNVRAQQRLLAHLGVDRLALAAGWSMGGMQALAWAAYAPERVDTVLSVCATARCWPMNQAFLAGMAPWLDRGREGLRPFGRAYAGWCYSAPFFRWRLHRRLGHETLDDLLTWWEEDHAGWDPDDLRTMLDTWRNADPGPRLEEIRARTIYAPCTTDQYFTLDEARLEASRIPDAGTVVLDSPWGHAAGRPGLLPGATALLASTVRHLLDERATTN